MTATKRDFLTLRDVTAAELGRLLDRAAALKADLRSARQIRTLQGRTLAMIFEKSSTRTRVSFEAGMAQLGGAALFLSPTDTQLGRGEPIEDSGRVIGRMCDAVMIRNDSHAQIETFAAHSPAPVINGLSELFHPCQLLADLLTLREHGKDLSTMTVAWIGDGNNVANSWALAADLLGFSLRVCTPAGYALDAALPGTQSANVTIAERPADAAAGADVVVTDVWASMGQEDEASTRLADFDGFQVDAALMTQAKTDAVFLHCLPAHRGEEVCASVIDGPQSVVWDEAENRLHAQKALLEWLMLGALPA